MDALEIAERNRRTACKILETTGIIPAWEAIGGRVNIVGSLRSGLMMKNLDIDMHVYTDRLDIADSFSVMDRFAQNPAVKEVFYKNLIDTEEECIEWHALYEHTDGKLWKFDMIHIRAGSKYDGTVERTTEAIIRRLTPQIRDTILRIKSEVPDGMLIPGIEIYHAVFTGGVESYAELERWRADNPLTDSMEWMP